ncbi:MAG TPA: polysaccharide deacetylase family protein [Candidatus Dorea merdavium]|nr:polysaccharide deacetylase family protein [Candidatus Dorea merdavium]
MTQGRKEGIRARQKRGRARTIGKVFALLLLCFSMPFLLKTATASSPGEVIQISAKGGSILQGEEMPALTAKVSLETKSKKDQKLDDSGFTVQDLAEELENGEGYTLVCEADPDTEGEYPVEVVLSEEIREKLEKEWVGLVQIQTKDAAFQVKNPVGDWDGTKFKKYDGTYVTNAFVVSMGNTYYFNEDGEKVTGWQTIGEKQYCFDKDGIMQTGWKEKDGDTYYMGSDGAAVTGWLELEDSTYYFHQDGKMAVGTVYLGTMMCKFGDDGKLISKEENKIDPNRPVIALTFDDGPGDRTGELLDQLEKYDAKATFFMLGQKVSSYPDEIKKMKEIGCELGNHSYDHPNLAKLGADGVKKQIGDTNSKIQAIVGEGASVMRPPYGAISATLKANAGMPLILWNIDTLDWKTRNAKATVDMVMENAKDGDIILMHDIHTESVDAAIELIPKLLEKGYQLVTVSELAAYKNVTLENGEKYTDF